MKKAFTLLLCVLLCFGLTACMFIRDDDSSDRRPTKATRPTSSSTDKITDDTKPDTDEITDSTKPGTTVTTPVDEEIADTNNGSNNINVPTLSTKVKNVNPATIKTYNGNLSKQDQVDTYTYVPARDGRYTFELSEVRSEIRLGIAIYDRLGKELRDIDPAKNGTYIAIDLKKGETYTVKVTQETNLGAYTLNIGEQPETLDFSAYSTVNDSIEFTRQINVYTFIPEQNGRYTFAFSEVRSEIRLGIAIYDRLGEELRDIDPAKNGTYIAIDLKKGETYTIKVSQTDSLGTYSLNIGKQKPTVENIAFDKNVNDAFEFTRQINVYTFTAKNTTHSITFSNMNNDIRFDTTVYNYLDETVGERDYCYNGDTLKLNNLIVGKVYTIKITQDRDIGQYTFILK